MLETDMWNIESIKSILVKNDIEVNCCTNKEMECESVYDLFRILVPDRILAFDPKSIFSIKDYHEIFERMIELTKVLERENLCISGSSESIIEFSIKSSSKKNFDFSIEQNGSKWISEEFFEHFNKYIEELLGCTYLIIPGDIITLVYLPISTAELIAENIVSMQSTDRLARALEGEVDIYDIEFRDISTRVQQGYTSRGETIVTHLIKASLNEVRCKEDESISQLEYVFKYVPEMSEIDFTLQNRFGETPYELLKQRGLLNCDFGNSMYSLKQTMSYKAFLEREMCEDSLHMKIDKRIISILESVLDKDSEIRIPKNIQLFFCCSHLKEYYFGQDNLTIRMWRDKEGGVKGFEFFAQKAGNGNNVITKAFTFSEVQSAIELLSNYINNSLWE